MICIGIDPDTRTVALALYDSALNYVVAVACIKRHRADRDTGSEGALQMLNVCRGCIDGLYAQAYPTGLKPIDCIVVEGQEIASSAKRGANPQNILPLAQVAGGLVLEAMYTGGARGRVLFPLPQEWKGSVPKVIHQARIYSRLNWPSETVGTKASAYTRPVKLPTDIKMNDINPGDWKHVGDAIGLAMWGSTRRVRK